jgi:hypothetical protein
LKSRLGSKLHRLLRECIHFEYGRIAVVKELNGILFRTEKEFFIDDKNLSIPLSLLWGCALKLGKCESFVEDLLKDVWGFILRPLWREKKSQAPTLSLLPDRAEIAFDNIARDQSIYISQLAISAGDGTIFIFFKFI